MLSEEEKEKIFSMDLQVSTLHIFASLSFRQTQRPAASLYTTWGHRLPMNSLGGRRSSLCSRSG